MLPLLIENDLLGIALLSFTLIVEFSSLLGPFAGVSQTLVKEFICQRVRVLIVRKIFMGFVNMLRLHSIIMCLYILKNYL